MGARRVTFSKFRAGDPQIFGSVGIATRLGLDGPEIESRWEGARFSSPVQTGPGAHPASYEMGTGSFPEVMRPSIAEVKERVELYFSSPLGPSWPVLE